MRRVSCHDVLEILNSVGVALLLPGDATQLITRVDLTVVDLQRAFETLACLVELAAALVNQAEIVMSRSVGGIECRRFEVLFESRLRALRTHDVAEVTAQQHEDEKQQEG